MSKPAVANRLITAPMASWGLVGIVADTSSGLVVSDSSVTVSEMLGDSLSTSLDSVCATGDCVTSTGSTGRGICVGVVGAGVTGSCGCDSIEG